MKNYLDQKIQRGLAIVIFLSFFQGGILASQATEDEFYGGYLSLAVTGGIDISSQEEQPVLALDFYGASADHEIRARIGLLYNALLITETLHNRPMGGLYPFSFFTMEIDYTVKQFRSVALQAGYLLAHQGYLHENFKNPTYQLQLGLRGGIIWFLHRNFMLRGDVSIPFGIYRHNLSNSFVVRNLAELTWDPLGPVQNPDADSAFYSLGFELEYISFSAYSRNYETTRYRPYLRFSLLY